MSRAQFEQFLIIVKCEAELNRIAAARIAIVERELTRRGRQRRPSRAGVQDGPTQLTGDEVSAFNSAFPELWRLDRYERRALSRRRRAIDNFVACTIVEAALESKNIAEKC